MPKLRARCPDMNTTMTVRAPRTFSWKFSIPFSTVTPGTMGLSARGWVRYTRSSKIPLENYHWVLDLLTWCQCLVLHLSMFKSRGEWDQSNFSAEPFLALLGKKQSFPFQQSALSSFLISLSCCGVADFMSVYWNVLSAGREEQMYEFLLKKILLIHSFLCEREKKWILSPVSVPIHVSGVCLTGRWQPIPSALEILSNVVFQNSKLGIQLGFLIKIRKWILSCHPLWCPAMFHFG